MISFFLAAALSQPALAGESVPARVSNSALFFDEAGLLQVVRAEAPERYDYLLDLRDESEPQVRTL